MHKLVECSWSGRGGKIAFRKYDQVLRLFGRIGDVGEKNVEKAFLDKFIQGKLQNAKNSSTISGVIKSVTRGSFTRKTKGRRNKKNINIV